MTLSIKEMVKDKKVKFEYYRDEALWYSTESKFFFPVPLADIGTATFLRDDKAILFMRWIRKHMEELEQEAKQEQECTTGKCIHAP